MGMARMLLVKILNLMPMSRIRTNLRVKS